MLIIDNLDARKGIKAVLLEGLKAHNPDTLDVMLCFDVSDPFNYKIALSVLDYVNTDFKVLFPDILPEGYIPKFLIDAKVFFDPGRMNIENTYAWVLSIALLISTEVKVTFHRNQKKVRVTLNIGAFTTETTMPLGGVESIFESTKS